MIHIGEKDGKVFFKVKVQPRASKNGLAGVIGDAVKLRITAPPVDGEANKAVIQFFAHLFHLPQKEVELVSGLSSRSKMVALSGVTMDQVLKTLDID